MIEDNPPKIVSAIDDLYELLTELRDEETSRSIIDGALEWVSSTVITGELFTPTSDEPIVVDAHMSKQMTVEEKTAIITIISNVQSRITDKTHMRLRKKYGIAFE